LHARILGINLPLDKALENLWYPNEEANLVTGRSDLEGEVLLDATGML
jgi:hypothetical protein